MWLPKGLYHFVPWFYLISAGCFMIFGKGNLFFEAAALLLGLLGVYVIFMRFIYGNSDRDKW